MTIDTANAQRRPAMTLIEVVVALGLGVVLLVAVHGVVVHAYRVAHALEEREAETRLRNLPTEMLAQDIDHLPAGSRVTLAGGTLSLVTAGAMQSDRLAARHVVAVRYTTSRQADGSLRLLRHEREIGEDAEDGSAVVLATDLSGVKFEVFDGARWHDTWPLRVARTGVALRVLLDWHDGEPAEKLIRLTPPRWRHHND